MYDTSLIKSRINCVTLAQRLGLPINAPGDRMVSPLRTGATNKTSFCVDLDYWYDFGSGSGGDVIDLYAELKCSGDRGRAIRELAQLTGVPPDGNDNTSEWVAYTNQLNAQAAYYHSKLTAEDRDYLHSRGLTDADIDRLMIGRVTDGSLRGRLFLPYFNSGYVCYYATRALPGSTFPDSKYMKQRKDQFCQHVPWGLQTLTRDSDTLIIAEGYFDAASFECSNYPVLSAITGRFSKEQLPAVLSAARRFNRVLIVYDNDPVTHAGDRFTESTARTLLQARIPFVVGTVPAPYHDISEYYAAGNSLAPIVANAQDGINYLVNSYHVFEDLERFCYSVSRHMKRSAIDDLFATIAHSERFNDRAVKSLHKSCVTAPPETIIADELIQQHQLIYINSIGFYEYAQGVWSRKSDTTIKSYADQAYGTFSTAQRISAVCALLKVRCLRDVDFDRKPLWNFINGTLELDSGVFRAHSPSDYCSIQAPYPYAPEATCDAWRQFISDVTNDDPRAEEILQFIPGYALFHDCPHEKIFVLTGSGGNGKSKYLQIINQLFGEDTCTHLQPRALLDKFQVIQLRSSIINLAGEIKSDIRDVEEVMKMIASGEPISGCYKGEQFVTFSSRAKLVFACNGQLSSGDTSEGLARRLIIVDFKSKFVDNPDPKDPYQHQKDIHIAERLLQEVASGGVFNWAYEGYKALKAVGYFTETYDQEELIQDFKMASNPVLLFYLDAVKPQQPMEISNKQLYSDYKMWCVENGYKPLVSNWFHREFGSVSQNEYEKFRTANEKGYRHR